MFSVYLLGMQMRNWGAWAFTACLAGGFVVGSGCGDDGRGDDGASDGMEDCVPGSLGCVCTDAGICGGNLVCSSSFTCEADGNLSAGDDGGGTSDGTKPDVGDSGGDGDGDGSVEDCASNQDCASNEACVAGGCYDTDWLYFDVDIWEFSPPSSVCDGDWGGFGELYYKIFESGSEVYQSEIAGCPGYWFETYQSYDSLQDFEIRIYEYDNGWDDDLVGEICWRDSDDACTPVPSSWLHEGGWSGMVGDSYMTMSFTAKF